MGYRHSEIGDGSGVVAEPGPGGVQSYRDLKVWQYGMDLVERVYTLTADFPTDERYGLTSQLRRASVSIPSNVAEGWGREATGEYVQFLRYARASLYEVETQVAIAERLGYLKRDQVGGLLRDADRLGRMLLGLIRSLKARR